MGKQWVRLHPCIMDAQSELNLSIPIELRSKTVFLVKRLLRKRLSSVLNVNMFQFAYKTVIYL